MYGISHDGVIRRTNVDGTGMTEVLDPGENPVLLRIDTVGGKLYWVDNSRIRRANLDGGPPEDLIELSATPSDFVLNLAQGQMVWESNGVLERAQLDGSGRQTIIVGARFPNDLALDLKGGRIYWTDAGGVRVANLDGTSSRIFARVLPPAQPNASASVGTLALDAEAGKLYWTSEPAGETYFAERISLDGSGREKVLEGQINGFAFDPEGVGTPPPDDTKQKLRLPMVVTE